MIELTVRRLYYENSACTRRTFAEQVEGLTIRYGVEHPPPDVSWRRLPSRSPAAPVPVWQPLS
jgi:hypothetical protein